MGLLELEKVINIDWMEICMSISGDITFVMLKQIEALLVMGNLVRNISVVSVLLYVLCLKIFDKTQLLFRE